MSDHRCIRCKAEEKPAIYHQYEWIPQPGEESGSSYWVLCDKCHDDVLKIGFTSELTDLAAASAVIDNLNRSNDDLISRLRHSEARNKRLMTAMEAIHKQAASMGWKWLKEISEEAQQEHP